MDSRLTKVPPTRATISVAAPKERGDIDETTVRQTIIKNVNAGKAKAYEKVEIKVHNDLQVKVQYCSFGSFPFDSATKNKY